MCTSLETDKKYDLLYDRIFLATGRMSHDKQNRDCLVYSQGLVMRPRGARAQEGLTDWPLVLK